MEESLPLKMFTLIAYFETGTTSVKHLKITHPTVNGAGYSDILVIAFSAISAL